MKLLGPTHHARLNEAAAVVYLLFGVLFLLCLVSYNPEDASFNTATSVERPLNLIGRAGAHTADLSLQLLGFGSFAFPVLLLVLAWKWFRSSRIEAPFIKIAGSVMLVL
ncbi:MAG: DNA translocase FtsK 4TM domain-containing protein [Bryobacteraceae bacterium]